MKIGNQAKFQSKMNILDIPSMHENGKFWNF